MNTRELTVITAALLVAGGVAISALALASEPEDWSDLAFEVQEMGAPMTSDGAGTRIEDMAQTQGAVASKI